MISIDLDIRKGKKHDLCEVFLALANCRTLRSQTWGGPSIFTSVVMVLVMVLVSTWDSTFLPMHSENTLHMQMYTNTTERLKSHLNFKDIQ